MAIAIGLLKVLLELQETRKTGALDVAGPGALVRLFVEDGRVVYADEGTVGETLGRILVRERVLTPEQYAAAIERMTQMRAKGAVAKLGEVFVELGLLTTGQVHAALSAQVQQKVMRALGWPGASFHFMESAGPLELADRFETSLEPLVVAALRLADRERIDELLFQARSRYVALRGDRVPGGGSTKVETLARLGACLLPAAEDAFARTLDGSRTIAELLAEREGPDVDRSVVFAALLLTDALDLHRGPTALRPATGPKLGADAKKAAKGALSKPKGKSVAPSLPEPTTASSASAKSTAPASPPARASALLAAIAQPAATSSAAVRTSASPGRMHDARSPTMGPLLAERAYQAGKQLVRAQRLADAVIELKEAASLYPAVEYDLWAAWAEARSDRDGEASHVARLRELAQLAIAQDSERGFATFVLAYLARREGDATRAAELFAKARAIDPEVVTLGGWEVDASANTGADAKADAGADAKADADADVTAGADAKADADALPRPSAKAQPDANGAGAGGKAGADAGARRARERARALPAPPRITREENARGLEAGLPGSARTFIVAVVGAGVVAAGLFLLRSRHADTEAESAPSASASTASATASVAIATATAAAAAPKAAEEAGATPMEDASAATVAPVSPGSPVSPTKPAPTTITTATADARDASASYAGSDASLPTVDATRGVLVLPSASAGHRVYVDGRVAGVPPSPIVVACGRHTVKIGSQGREQAVLVPCGGSVSLVYP